MLFEDGELIFDGVVFVYIEFCFLWLFDVLEVIYVRVGVICFECDILSFLKFVLFEKFN